MEKLTLVYTNGKPFNISARRVDVDTQNSTKVFTIEKIVRRQKKGGVFIKDSVVSTISVQKSDLLGYRLKNDRGIEFIECLVPQKVNIMREVLRTNEAIDVKNRLKKTTPAKRTRVPKKLRVFNVVNTMKHELHVAAFTERQARSIARRRNHILKPNTGKVVDITDNIEDFNPSNTQWGQLVSVGAGNG